ncbi:MAG: ferrous iron transport protein B, partial [bacterium]
DLPGTYSLSPYSEEEVVARDFLIYERPDVIINVVDSTNLERNLQLTIQLLELEIPVILVLNMFDEVESKGYSLNIDQIEEVLGVKAIPTIATRKKGIRDLLARVHEIIENPACFKPSVLRYTKDIDAAVEVISQELKEKDSSVLKRYPNRWLAYKILERDNVILDRLQIDAELFFAHPVVKHLQTAHNEDVESFLAESRYALASGLTKEVLKRPLMPKIEITETIDRIVLNRFLSIPLFFVIMWLMFKMTFDIATPFVDWIDFVVTGPLTRWTTGILGWLHASDWLRSLLVEGILGGVGFVLAFVPVIFSLMFIITFLEGSGYMARAAFVMDRYMHIVGLHGKSFIPMIMGFGCNVPGVYATRTLENRRDRILTALLLPLMSCSARLPVYVLIIGAFFENHKGTVLFSIYMLGIVLSILIGILFKKTLFRGATPVFIMELPPYRLPSIKSLLIHTWEKVKHFIIKAGTYILAMSVIIWFALNLPWGVEHKKDSFLGQTAQIISPVLQPLGFGRWEITASLLTGIVAKEIVISTLGEIFAVERSAVTTGPEPSVGEDIIEIGVSFGHTIKKAFTSLFSAFSISSISTEEAPESLMLRSVIQKQFSPLSAYSFMIFVLLYMPCIVTGIAMKQEFDTWSVFLIAVVYGILLAWVTAFLVYQGGTLLGIGI